MYNSKSPIFGVLTFCIGESLSKTLTPSLIFTDSTEESDHEIDY